jgi:hypothetical protein
MITNRAGVVLLPQYGKNIDLELQLVMDVYEKLLKDVWCKKTSDDEFESEEIE